MKHKGSIGTTLWLPYIHSLCTTKTKTKKQKIIFCSQENCTASDGLTHTPVLVNVFQKKLLEFLRGFLPNLKKLYYFSDGSAALYKNHKNVVKFCYHREDFDGTKAVVLMELMACGKSISDKVHIQLSRTHFMATHFLVMFL